MEIKDSVWGSIKLSPIQEELINTPELQRLNRVKQLSLVHLVFDGATNTRFAHAIGSSYISGQMAEHLGLPENEKILVQTALLLHDIGHPPFSHALGDLLEGGHEKTTADMLTGKRVLDLHGKTGQIPNILYKHGLNERTIADLINQNYKGKPYLQQIIHHIVDADQLDYLVRDSRSLGVKIGDIDIDRTLDVLTIQDDQIGVIEKGVPQMEMILFAKQQMYSQVYIHHTAAAAEAMLLEALNSSKDKIPDFINYGDDEILLLLELKGNEISKELAGRIKARELYKTAFEIKTRDINAKNKELVKKLYNLEQYQQDDLQLKIRKASRLEEGEVITRMPVKRLAFDEPRLKIINMQVMYKNGKTKDLAQISEIAKLLASQEGSTSYFSVYCSEENKEKVKEATETVLAKNF